MFSQKATYLITGGAGFIGANFLKYLLNQFPRKNHSLEIVVLDKLTYAGNIDAISSEIQQKNIHFIQGDICDRLQLEKIFEKYDIDFVINFAAESHVDRSIQNPQLFLQTNVIGTQHLIDVAMHFWKEKPQEDGTIYQSGKKFLQVSTDEVYGFLPIDYPDGKPYNFSWELKKDDISSRITFGKGSFLETNSLNPSSPYAASKAAADLLARSYFKTYKFPLYITRCGNNYGPYQHVEKFIPMAIKSLMEQKNIPVYGDGKQVRDWIYVEDHCRGIFQVLHCGKLGEVYNIGGGCEVQNISLLERMIHIYAQVSDQEMKLPQFKNLISYVEDRLGHDRRYAIDFSKSYHQVGFLPTMNFEEGLRKTILWYLKNKLNL